MFILYISSFVLFSLLLIVKSNENVMKPGRITIWKSNKQRKLQDSSIQSISFDINSNNNIYNTKTIEIPNLFDYLNENLFKQSNSYIVIRVDDSIDSSIHTCSGIKSSIDESKDLYTMPYVYKSSDNVDNSIYSLIDNKLINNGMNKESLSIDSLINKLQSNDELNGVYDINLAISKDLDLIDSMIDLINQNTNDVSLIAIDEPSYNAFIPSNVNEYHRILSETQANVSSSTSIYYKPEGAEYSIYYADTYLYITPDIFTGIMTSIFIAFVLYIGLSCLGAIQGASSFVMKPIPIGKEY